MNATKEKLVAYYRVSTAKQGASGLGLEAQQTAVEQYARSIGARIVAPPFKEVESGKRKDRPQLAAAIARAKALRATLVIAKLDRLARNVAFVSALLESGVDFVACDNPHANKLTIHILSAVAEAEAEAISARTKAALAAARRRGVKLGAERPECRNLTAAAVRRGSKAGGEANAQAAAEHMAVLLPLMTGMRADGATLQGIADRLNADGYTTRRGGLWSHVQIKLALDRVAEHG